MASDDHASLDVTVWLIPLNRDPVDLAPLAPDELARSQRFYHARDRRRFLGRRLARRRILGALLGCDPASIRFVTGPDGKPDLEWPAGTGLEFNCSSSGDRAAVAVARGRPLGIDIEQYRVSSAEALSVAAMFAPEERAALAALGDQAREVAFHECWARKEAFLKALGTGLMRPLDGFAVTVGAEESPRLLRVDWDPAAPGRWHLARLDLGPGWAGAVASDRPVRIHRLATTKELSAEGLGTGTGPQIDAE